MERDHPLLPKRADRFALALFFGWLHAYYPSSMGIFRSMDDGTWQLVFFVRVHDVMVMLRSWELNRLDVSC